MSSDEVRKAAEKWVAPIRAAERRGAVGTTINMTEIRIEAYLAGHAAGKQEGRREGWREAKGYIARRRTSLHDVRLKTERILEQMPDTPPEEQPYHPTCSICRSRHGREVEHPCE